MNSRNTHRNSLQSRNTRFKNRSLPIFPPRKRHGLKNNSSNLLSEVYEEFSRESSIHGIKYTSRSKSIPERILWAFLIILSVIAAGILAQKFYYRHKQGNMRTLVISNQYPSWKIPLPAVTICQSTVASADRLNKYMRESKKLKMPSGLDFNQFLNDLQFLKELYIPTNHFQNAISRLNRIVSYNNLSVSEFTSIMSPSCDDYIVLCRSQGEIKPCSRYLKISMTPYGICCSANYDPLPTEQKSEYYSSTYGEVSLLSVILRNSSPEDRISGLFYGDGARVLIHDRHTYPGPSSREFIASRGSEVTAYIDGHTLTASPEVLSLSQKERDCRTSDPGSITYRLDNCLANCHEMMSRSQCQCVPLYASVILGSDTICNFTHVACMSGVKSRIARTSFRGYPCHCLPDCEGTSYSVATTAVPMNAVQYNPSEFYRIARRYPNVTAIHVTFARQTAMLLRRDLVLSWINLVWNVFRPKFR
ncbi:sodium channel protein Nach-like isoform X2 [Fopius arisanus]|uniref:Sodium channel protein Nach-like isoform X2 n=1 Tax=Fopius arisanus TaxID=64838 RepID=A0A9R1U295_9HYME|nr:PREDICTED: sodium channel protein Nach-like isoform X2 [Fopius arisanus]